MTSLLDPVSTEPLLVASVDELRVLATLAGAVLPPVCDAGDEGESPAADLAAVRSLLARGWLDVADDATAGATDEVRHALGALVAPDLVVEVEVRRPDDLVRQALVLGPAGGRWLREVLLGVWALEAVTGDPLARLDDLASLGSEPAPATTPVASGARRVLDAEAELEAGGHEVVLRRARRLGGERYEADELQWLVGPGGRWVIEPAELDLDAEGPPEDIALPVGEEELDLLVVGFLADVAEGMAS
ncbi:hypothetical protein KSP35_00520 [Aquihabitans sp. G128]|uniref:hypothetical protein n=1 Tax=Aquihabitans sp. G128 TaxID=2849779 RepID=UPI001C22A532|nr:hypothetical protein [Aquihabitans sp. G128]QXC61375.1 hypothetical protein KSP35_00520 [Aquihabitans sp. G128]